jgi:penicillin-binding protein 1C
MNTKNFRQMIFLYLGSFAVLSSALFSLWLFWDLPTLANIPQNTAIPSIRITDRYGRILYELQPEASGRHTPIPFENIPDHLKIATIATEDRNFYTNSGVDFAGVLRSAWINFKGQETLAGGSTITQQVARNLILSSDEQFERTLRRKLREVWLAWRLTQKFSKDEILTLYLNQMYYGGLSYGVEAAAQTYFGKPAAELGLAEAALIAGIPQAPAIYNPLINPEAAQNRQKIVLEIMHNQGLIDATQYQLAIRETMIFTSQPFPIHAPHFVMWISAKLDEIFNRQNITPSDNLIVTTTLDLNWQQLAENAVQRQIEALGSSNPNAQGHNVPGGHNVHNAALIAIDSHNGEILTMVGSPDYFDSHHAGAINMALAPRQPGSALKPLVYAAAFDPHRTHPWTAATMILDVRTTFTTHDGEAYTPANYDNLEHGPVSARQALGSSLNIPAVKALEFIGLADLFDFATEMGITTFGNPLDYDLSLSLGGGEVRLLELTAAYGVFANLGQRVSPTAILEIKTTAGQVIYQPEKHPPTQVVAPEVAWLISDILSDNEARSIGFSPNSALNIDRQAAVKTGTTTNFHDNWTIGYTPEIVVGVWVGNANHEPMRGVDGLSGAAPIWHQFIREALTGGPETWFERPPDFESLPVCAVSGKLPTTACPYTRSEWFIAGTAPTKFDSVFHQVWVDRRTSNSATESTPPENRQRITAVDLPPAAHPWARAQGYILMSDLSQATFENENNWESSELQIVSPGDKTIYRRDPNLSAETQKLAIEAASATPMAQIEIWLDNELWVKFTQPPYKMWWSLIPGEHTLWAEGISQDGVHFKSPELKFQVVDKFDP